MSNNSTAHKNPLLAATVFAVTLVPFLVLLAFGLYSAGVPPMVASVVMVITVLLIAKFVLPRFMNVWDAAFTTKK